MDASGDVRLRDLEESLWREETRFDRAYMDAVLHPDFFEFGASGRVYARSDSLDAPPSAINASLPLEDFSVEEIDECTVLVTYVSDVTASQFRERANRSSIWVWNGASWRLRFHQGTVRSASD